MNTTFSIGVIGAGYMAEEHIKAFQAFDNVKVNGIFSRTESKSHYLSTAYNIPYVCNSVQDLYIKAKPDLLVVAVTETAVETLVDELVKYPWSVLFEKPVGLNYEQAKRICDRAAGLRVIVALNRRFYSCTKHVIDDLKVSKGNYFIQVNDYQSLAVAKSFQYSDEIINQWMYANSIHLIDYFCFLGRGKIEDVNVVQKWNPENLLPVIAHIKFESGDEGLYQGIWNGPGPWSISVTTESDYFEMKPLEQAARRTLEDRTLRIYSQTQEDIEFKPGLYQQAKNALNFVIHQPSRSVTLSEALRTMELINKIYSV